MRRGMLVAASREMVMNAVHAVQQAGLVATNRRPLVVRRAPLARHPGPPGDGRRGRGAGRRRSARHEHRRAPGRRTRFIRILLMGGQDLTDAVADRMGVGGPQAEAMKQEVGLRSDVPESSLIASRVIDAAASTFVDEVRGSLDYYTTRVDGIGQHLPAGADRRRSPADRARGAPAVGHPHQGRGREPDPAPRGRQDRAQPRADRVRPGPSPSSPVGLALGAV